MLFRVQSSCQNPIVQAFLATATAATQLIWEKKNNNNLDSVALIFFLMSLFFFFFFNEQEIGPRNRGLEVISFCN